jgi:hypothetical protein
VWDVIIPTRILGLIDLRLLSWKWKGREEMGEGVLRGSEWPDMWHGKFARVE